MSNQSSKTMGPSGWFATRCWQGARPNAGLVGKFIGQLRDTVSPSRISDFCAERMRAGVKRLMRPICELHQDLQIEEEEFQCLLRHPCPISMQFLDMGLRR
jgi:hypothetical protein